MRALITLLVAVAAFLLGAFAVPFAALVVVHRAVLPGTVAIVILFLLVQQITKLLLRPGASPLMRLRCSVGGMLGVIGATCSLAKLLAASSMRIETADVRPGLLVAAVSILAFWLMGWFGF